MPLLTSRTLHDAAFEAVVEELRADRTLASLITTWRRWSTDPGDDGIGEPTPAHCPLIQLTPLASESGAVRESSDGTNLTYRLPLAVEIRHLVTARPGRGLHRSDALDLSAHIYAALWPEDATAAAALATRLRTVGVADVRLVRPILPVSYDNQFIESAGLIEMVQFANF